MRVITELFKRGDIVSADTLKPPSAEAANQSAFSAASIRSTLAGYIWGSKKPSPPGLDDPIVPLAAMKAATSRAESLAGPIASADIQTVKSFANAVTAENTRDAEAVIGYLISNTNATALFTEPTKENPDPVLGVKLGKVTVNQADRGVLRTKAALENMEQLSFHLETAIATEKEAATQAAKLGNKPEALSRLRKKKVLEAKLTGAKSAATKLADVLMAVDEAESNKEAVLALETGMSSLRLATENGVTVDRVDAVAADYKELMAGQEDARLALEQLGQDTAGDDALLEEELEGLLSQEEPQRPAEILAKPPVKTLADEAEEELAKLLENLPVPSQEVPPDAEQAALESLTAAPVVSSAANVEDSRNVVAPNL